MLRCSCQRITLFTYNAFAWCLSPAFAFYAFRRIQNATRMAAIYDWTGRYPKTWANTKGLPRFWVHAVSVGEVIAASSVVKALRDQFQNPWILLTTVTEAGMKTAKQRASCADAFAFLPFDLYPFPRWAMERVRPDVLILVETELWGNLMHTAKQFGAKAVLVNGRISDSTFIHAQNHLWKPIYRWLFSHLDLCLMRSEMDLDRIKRLGVQNEKVYAVGDIKLDQPEVSMDEATKERLRLELGLISNNRSNEPLLWIAGSTHEGEETIILRTHQFLQKKLPNLRLLIAPRHLERLCSVLAEVQSFGFTPRLRSLCDGKEIRENEVIVLDTVGELAKFYGLAKIAFVGGSLVPRGGHNIMEPILHRIPVLFGKYTDNFRPHAQLLNQENIGFQVQNEEELKQTLLKMLQSNCLMQAIASKSDQLLKLHRGASERVVNKISTLLT